MRTSESITFCYLRSQSIKLLCRSLGSAFSSCQLSLAQGMHDFYAGNRTAHRPKGLEAQHRPHLAFHRAVILLDDVIQIFRVADSDSGLVHLIVMLNRRRIRPTLIDGDFLGEPLSANSLT